MMIDEYKKYVSYGLVMFGSSAMNNIFVTYYLDFFVNVHKIDYESFYAGQVIFMLWNAFNDPLFGYLSDGRNRSTLIRIGGILWCFAFVLVFYSADCRLWQFALVLCLYDTMLTLVEVNHSALMADISKDSIERANLNMWSAIGAGIGALSSVPGHSTWNPSDLSPFRNFVLVVAAICMCSFLIAAQGLAPFSKTVKTAKGARLSMSHLLKQLLKHKNMLCFQFFYFIQVFDCSFGKNHFSIFLNMFAGEYYTAAFLGTVISLSFILPWIATIGITPLIGKYGLYHVVLAILATRALVCIIFPFTNPFVILMNRVLSECICRICPLIISDLVDEDQFLNKRVESVSASLVGFSTILGKSSQSLAPMFGFALLQDQGFLSYAVYMLPLACVVCQLLLWSRFTLRGEYLLRVKAEQKDSNV